MVNLINFSTTVDRDVIEQVIKDALTNAMNTAVEKVRNNTPVDTGYLKSNWYWAGDLGSFEVRGVRVQGVSIDLPQWEPHFGGRSSIEPSIPSNLYIVNNVDYGYDLEFGTGSVSTHIGFFRNSF